MKTNREYRDLQKFEQKENFIVEGYASTFEPYLMHEADGIKVYEHIHKEAFKNADLSDFLFQVDHAGKVYARVSNETLKYRIDDHGLFIQADLSKTEAGRELYEEIKQGMYIKMSFSFVINQDHYDAQARVRHITDIKKVYDVSVCGHAANDGTHVSARSYFTGVVKPAIAEREARQALIDEYMRKVVIK